MYTIYLKDEDLMKAAHFPAIALINEACNSDIFEFVENLTKGIGSGYNYSTCSFWNELDEYDQANIPKFEGLWISNEAGEELIISFVDFLYYLEILYTRVTFDEISKKSRLRRLLDSFKEEFC